VSYIKRTHSYHHHRGISFEPESQRKEEKNLSASKPKFSSLQPHGVAHSPLKSNTEAFISHTYSNPQSIKHPIFQFLSGEKNYLFFYLVYRTWGVNHSHPRYLSHFYQTSILYPPPNVTLTNPIIPLLSSSTIGPPCLFFHFINGMIESWQY